MLSHLRKQSHGLMSEKEFTEIVVVPLAKALTNPTLITYTLARYQVYDLARRLNYKIKYK